MTRAEYARRALLRSIEADGVKLRRGLVELAQDNETKCNQRKTAL